MLPRKYLFPHVIEMNYQAGRRLGVNVYLIDGGSEFVLIDIGYLDTVDEIIDLIRRMDFNLSACKMIIATHADADHIQIDEIESLQVREDERNRRQKSSGEPADSGLLQPDRKSTRLNSSHVSESRMRS